MPTIDRQLRIMAIDDDPFELKLMTHQLSMLGQDDVVVFSDPVAALDRIEEVGEDAFELVFCDLQMPGIDGITFQRRLVRSHFGGQLVLFSGEDDRTVQAAANLARRQNLRLLGILKKPIDLKALGDILVAAAPAAGTDARPSRKRYSHEELRRAIDQKELINYYQPKVLIATGQPIEVECLVRWQHPDDGLVFPDQFIPVAEEHGLIDDLTQLVLTNALHQAAHWREHGLSLRVAVNISMDNLGSLDFPEQVMAALEAAGVPAESLILEVTESRLMQDPVAVLDILTRLRLRRVRLSIDDFGIGHSSLAQLRDLPFDELKIDRSFVHGAHANPQKRAILHGSIDMGRQLGMQTIAEGVEDIEDWRVLKDLGCDLAQGYFCARPMPGEAMPAWVTEWKQRFIVLEREGVLLS
ncbi:MAG: EAL domain protein [Rhodobacteraceae bacterium HLUCCA12]|nr:MAG: EAL domain protein [Rhodobacteraceae bacterium HLUCCA12]